MCCKGTSPALRKLKSPITQHKNFSGYKNAGSHKPAILSQTPCIKISLWIPAADRSSPSLSLQHISLSCPFLFLPFSVYLLPWKSDIWVSPAKVGEEHVPVT